MLRNLKTMIGGRAKVQVIAVSLLFLALLVVFFPRVFLHGDVISANDIAYTDPAFRPMAPSGFDLPHNYILADQPQQFYTSLSFLVNAVKHGHWPKWNPHILCGNSFAGNIISQSYYPLNILALFMPITLAKTVASILELLLAGVGTMLLLRRFKASLLPSAFGAIAFMFCSYNLVWLNHPHSSVATWTPWFLLALNNFFKHPKASCAHNIFACAVIVALMVTAGHPGTLLNVLLLGACYCAYEILKLMVSREPIILVLRKSCTIGFAVVLGISLTAIVLFPFYDFLRHESISYYQRMNMAANAPPLQLKYFIVALLPHIYGGPVTLNDANAYNFSENAMFIGCASLLLCAIMFPRALKSKQFRFFGVMCFVIIAAIAGLNPLYYILRNMPFLRHSVFQRMILIAQFSGAICAGLAFQTLLDSAKQTLSCFERIWVISVSSGILVAALILYFLRPTTPGIAVFSASSALVALFCCVIATLKHRNAIMLSYLLPVILFVELLAAHGAYNLVMPERYAELREPEMVKHIKRESGTEWFRIASADSTLGPNYGSLFHLNDIRGYDLPMSKRYTEFIANAFYHGEWNYGMSYWYCGQVIVDPKNRVLTELLGIRYILENGTIFRSDSDFRPHAFFASNVCRSSGSIKSDVELIREGSTPVETEQNLPNSIPHPIEQSSVKALSESINGATFRVETPVESIFIFNEMPIKGWRARVDGVPSKVFPANVVQTSTLIPAGKHVVEFEFLPKSFLLGAWVSLVSLIVLSIIMAYPVLLFSSPTKSGSSE